MVDNQDDKGWLEVFTGTAFEFGSSMNRDMIHLTDIEHSLARSCRYNGHTNRHFSVAEHSIIMANWVAKQHWSNCTDVLTALLHDAAETYIGDLVRPVKNEIPDFKALEARIDELVAEKFCTIYPFPAWLKEADFRILHDERRSVMFQSNNIWESDHVKPLGVDFMWFRGRFPMLVEWKFRSMYDHYNRGRNQGW